MIPNKKCASSDLCACKDCPSAGSHMTAGSARPFCQTGAPSHNMITQDCLCDGCPVEPESALRQVFFCENNVAPLPFYQRAASPNA